MGFEVRPCYEDEIERFLEICEASFGKGLPEEDTRRLKHLLEPERTLAAFDESDIVGTNAAYRVNLTIPGGELPAAGVTMVGVLPSHRRRGILTALVREQLDTMRDWGEPLAVLWASEGAIYQRFGYGMAAPEAGIDLERDLARFLTPSDSIGRMVLITEEEALKVLPAVYDRVRTATPGMLSRSQEWWEHHRLSDPKSDREGAGPMFRALLEIDGEPTGYVLYRISPSWGKDGIHKGAAEVIEAIAPGPAETRELWRFILGIDLVARIQCAHLQVDHPLRWWLVEPRRLRLNVRDGLWLRVVDLEQALEARTYAQRGRVVFELSDPICKQNDGVWALEASPEGGTVSRTNEEPELGLGASELGAVYLGGTRLAELAGAARVRELAPGAVARFDSLFATPRMPWCPEIF